MGFNLIEYLTPIEQLYYFIALYIRILYNNYDNNLPSVYPSVNSDIINKHKC